MGLGYRHRTLLPTRGGSGNRRLVTIVAVAALAAGAAGCGGGREIEPSKAEAFVRGAIEPAPRAVDCPEGVEVDEGKTFECDVTTTDNRRATITVHIADDEGNVRVGEGDLKPR